ILRGERPEDISLVHVPSVAMFDQRELRRWGISEKSLPAGSLVAFRDPSFWERYGSYIILVLVVFIIEGLLIAGLLINRARRRQADKESTSLARLAEARRKKLDEVVSNLPGVVWELRLEPGSGAPKVRFVSSYAEKMLGYSVEEWLSRPDFVQSILHDEDREAFARQRDRLLASGQ